MKTKDLKTLKKQQTIKILFNQYEKAEKVFTFRLDLLFKILYKICVGKIYNVKISNIFPTTKIKNQNSFAILERLRLSLHTHAHTRKRTRARVYKDRDQSKIENRDTIQKYSIVKETYFF